MTPVASLTLFEQLHGACRVRGQRTMNQNLKNMRKELAKGLTSAPPSPPGQLGRRRRSSSHQGRCGPP